MSFLQVARTAIYESRREQPRLFCRAAVPGHPGWEAMFTAGGCASRHLLLSHLVAVTPYGLRSLVARTSGLAQASAMMPTPGSRRLMSTAVERIREGLASGYLVPSHPAPHHFSGPAIPSADDLPPQGRLQPGQQPVRDRGEDQRLLSRLWLRGEAAWCRNVEPYLDPAGLRLLSEDIPRLWPHLEAQCSGRSSGTATVYVGHGILAVDGLRFPRLLTMPWMAGAASVYARIASLGDEASRNWSQVVELSPPVAMQALLDKPLLDRILAGREIAGLVQRRLGLKGVVAPERVMAALTVSDGPGPHEQDAGWAAWNSRSYAFLSRISPRTDFRAEEASDPSRKHRILADFFFASWATGPMLAGTLHPRRSSLVTSRRTTLAHETVFTTDWRIRYPDYAVRNMAVMVANGAFHEVFSSGPLERSVQEEIAGFTADVAALRTWSLTQLVAPVLARHALREWERLGCPVGPSRIPRGSLVYRMNRWSTSDLFGTPLWFLLGAEALAVGATACAHVLPAAFADLAFPRSAKRLRRLVVLQHQARHRRDVASAGGARTWAPLFTAAEVRLPGHAMSCVPLTDADALVREGVGMRHCVAQRTFLCLRGSDHILSVRDDAGNGLSTLHLRLGNRGGRPVFAVVEHRGYRNRAAPPEAIAFVDRMASLLASRGFGGLPVDPAAADLALLARKEMKQRSLIQHDPFAADAHAVEDDILGIYRDSGLDREMLDRLCAAVAAGPVPMVRMRL
jgi:hypothetical protein